jgi:hypothetical protein
MRDVNKKTPTKKLDKKSWDTKLGEDIIGGFKSIFGKDMIVPSKGGIQSERDKSAESELADDLQIGEWTGKHTEEGRKIYHNNKGGVSSEITMGVEIDGKEYHIPTIFDGKRVTLRKAKEIIVNNGMKDPETGRLITPGGNPGARSSGLGGPVTFDIESETDESVKFLAKTENEPLDPYAVGYKVVPKVVDGKKVKKADGRTTMVYAKDKKGEKIPVSFGLMQLTVKTASGTKYGRRLFNKKKANTMDEKIDLLMNPKHNVAIGKEFKNTLKRKIKERLSKIGKKWSEQDIETATIAAYNWNGENFPSVIERTKANNLNQLLQKWDAREDQFVPEETKNHIRRYREMRGW